MAVAYRPTRTQRRAVQRGYYPPPPPPSGGVHPLTFALLGLGGLGAWWVATHGSGSGASTCPPLGSLAVGVPSQEIYIIATDVNGATIKRHIANGSVLTDVCHYNPAKYVYYEDTALLSCPTGPDVNATSGCPPEI